MENGDLKTALLSLLKEDPNFRKQVVSIVQEDLLDQLSFRADTTSERIDEIEVVGEIDDIDVSFNNFHLDEEEKELFETIVVSKFSPFITFDLKQPNKNIRNYILYHVCGHILKLIPYHNIPGEEHFLRIIDDIIKHAQENGYFNSCESFKNYIRYSILHVFNKEELDKL